MPIFGWQGTCSGNSDNHMKRLDALKYRFVTEMFVDPADQDYVVARWCYLCGMYGPFFWNAAQSIEKYLKAVLLLNQRTSKGYSHNILRLFDDVQKIGGEHIPPKLVQPQEIHVDYWEVETPRDFVARFNDFGDPNNRYNFFGFEQSWWDLAHYDQLVWAIRRLTVGLDWRPIWAGEPVAGRSSTWSEMLSAVPDCQPRRLGRFRKIMEGNLGIETKKALLSFNFCFQVDDFEHPWEDFRMQMSAEVPTLLPWIEFGPDHEAAALADWVLRT